MRIGTRGVYHALMHGGWSTGSSARVNMISSQLEQNHFSPAFHTRFID